MKMRQKCIFYFIALILAISFVGCSTAQGQPISNDALSANSQSASSSTSSAQNGVKPLSMEDMDILEKIVEDTYADIPDPDFTGWITAEEKSNLIDRLPMYLEDFSHGTYVQAYQFQFDKDISSSASIWKTFLTALEKDVNLSETLSPLNVYYADVYSGDKLVSFLGVKMDESGTTKMKTIKPYDKERYNGIQRSVNLKTSYSLAAQLKETELDLENTKAYFISYIPFCYLFTDGEHNYILPTRDWGLPYTQIDYEHLYTLDELEEIIREQFRLTAENTPPESSRRTDENGNPPLGSDPFGPPF